MFKGVRVWGVMGVMVLGLRVFKGVRVWGVRAWQGVLFRA